MFGSMNSGKTAQLLMQAHNLREQGKKIILLKPVLDSRSDLIYSRAVSGLKADYIIKEEDEEITVPPGVSYVLVDEAQFLSHRNVMALREIAQAVCVICYGIRTDVNICLFPGAAKLMEVADYIEQIHSLCFNCNRPAMVNAKYCIRGNEKCIIKYTKPEDTVDVGGNDKYVPLCYSCFSE